MTAAGDASAAGWAAEAGAAGHVFVETLADRLDVDGADGHHLARVLRLRPGEVVTAADGRGTWRPYTVKKVSGTGVHLEARSHPVVEPEPAPRLAVAFALTKGGKPELTVQKLTELGVDRILPVLSQRSVARPDRARAGGAVARWRRLAREAARQCRRARLPEVAELSPLAELLGHAALVVAERGGIPPAGLPSPPGGELLVVVGPEGGLAPAEIEELAPWALLDLGPLVLRAETAALAAAAILRTGRWRRG
jgi:16S rRNA (uracil1498-N3)-methyltransferase